MLGQRQSGSIQASGFGHEVVVILRAGVDQRRRDAGGVRGNRLCQARASFPARSCRRFENLTRPDECHQSDGDFLPVHPVWTQVGRVGLYKFIEIVPERFSIGFALGQVVGAAEEKRPSKAGRFPDKFEIAFELELAACKLRPVDQGPVPGQ